MGKGKVSKWDGASGLIREEATGDQLTFTAQSLHVLLPGDVKVGTAVDYDRVDETGKPSAARNVRRPGDQSLPQKPAAVGHGRVVPRLIEVALPIREISAESVRDKSLRHGHISTLHLWFARRPLAASRAVVFASLVPDPDHPDCPLAFREAVERHLKTHVPDVLKSYRRGKVVHMDPDPYRPYEGLPDTLRNRLMMFVAKWSPEWVAFDQGKSDKEPKSENLLDDRSLVKWETSGPTSKVGSKELPNEAGRKILWIARELTRIGNGGQIPTVLDPFSGGGAIPLEAGRVGAQPFANDYNPVAYLILRATCEFPQKYGKPGQRAKTVASGKPRLFGDGEMETVPNVLAHDVEHYAREILRRAREKIGHLFPVGKDKHPVIGYLWARTIPCANCQKRFPLIRSLYVCNTRSRKIALQLVKQGDVINIGLRRGKEITTTDGTMISEGRGNARCPHCTQVNSAAKDIKPRTLSGKMSEQLLVVITDTPEGRGYRLAEPADLAAIAAADDLAKTAERPSEPMPVEYSQAFPVITWGFTTWGSLFTNRQLVSMQTLAECARQVLGEVKKAVDADYYLALATYLGLWFGRASQRGNNQATWQSDAEKFAHPFSMQRISLAWDFAEVNPFNDASGGAAGNIEWITKVIEQESNANSRPATVSRGDSTSLSLKSGSIDAVVTDPPYFDAIAYADLSDMFYIWQKRVIGDDFPENYATPLTPKVAEATALKHRFKGSIEDAEKHFTSKLSTCLGEARRICKADGVVSIMFAHQSTEAWTALIHSLFNAGLNITATFPIDTERKARSRGMSSSALASSITVACRARLAGSLGSYKEVRRDIERVVKESVHRFWNYGFRGADLIVACYGPAVGEFGRYERVERGDGTPVNVPELLQLVREAALKAIAGEFTGDELSRLYFVWANLYGVSEQPWDDVRTVVQIGGESENAMDVATGRGLFVVDATNSRLAVLADRHERPHLGADKIDPLIDQLHRAMLFWKNEDRTKLVHYLHGHELGDHSGFWRLAQALFEVLPHDIEDWKLVSALLGERTTLRTEIKRREAALSGGAGLFDGQDE
ncbi:DUF1156 domain-containing protein [Frigoriglobus tundricola]|uniref:Adenine-specific DNA methylase containing a Zn-ribbon n=1 Tax=Frigoriglobus tundricola TaxID=2774151 RepID=A0A6M5YUY1_9BACT|nr:DUF1156 domain-containing protein [Frigoriglobus tundricola]QJW97250.1 Adenine-specific DNA methylase containing a Zn-ribbon [Frigoriglobus tundricola]